MELPGCNTDTFQVFLNEFARINAGEFKIILLDNGAFHKAKRLILPANIALIFIPPYSPELNPAEKIWWRIKRSFTGKNFTNLEQLSGFIDDQVNALTKDIVKSICAFEYLFACPFWTNLN